MSPKIITFDSLLSVELKYYNGFLGLRLLKGKCTCSIHLYVKCLCSVFVLLNFLPQSTKNGTSTCMIKEPSHNYFYFIFNNLYMCKKTSEKFRSSTNVHVHAYIYIIIQKVKYIYTTNQIFF